MVWSLFLWSAKISLTLTIIYGAYWLLFKKSTRFVLKRSLLLFSLLLAIVMPFVEVEVPIAPIYRAQEIKEVNLEIFENKLESTVTVNSKNLSTDPKAEHAVSWKTILIYVYSIGVSISSLMLFIEMFKLALWYFLGIRRNDIQDNIITHRRIKYPFSFWKWIFIPAGTDYAPKIWQIIEKHESAHLKQGHSFDTILTSITQCFLWYNPIIYLLQKEIKENHEALADQSVLRFTDFKSYAKALVGISLNYPSLRIGHSFAENSSLSKRIAAMKKQKTTYSRTMMMVTIFLLISGTTIAFSVLKAQDFRNETQEEALERLKKDIDLSSTVFLHGKLSMEHRKVLNKLKYIYPEKEIFFLYMNESNSQQYLGLSGRTGTPLYFGEVDNSQKAELYNLLKADTSRLKSMRFSHSPNSQAVALFDMIEKVEESIYDNCNYIIFYEPNYDTDVKIYDIDEVDTKPEPIGGVEAFTRSIALDIELPETISKRDLPKTIDYEIVVNGGRILANVNLLTELKGSDRKNKELYLFFGNLLKEIQDKSRQFYLWKSGIKDGKEVRVRMKISIPTKYM